MADFYPENPETYRSAQRFNPYTYKYPQMLSGALLKGLSPALLGQAELYTSTLPYQGAALRNLMQLTTPEGQESPIEGVRRSATADAGGFADLTKQRLSAGGAGIGAMQGADVSAFNTAQRSANDMRAWYASPQGRAALMQMISGAQRGILGLPEMAGLSQISYGRPQPQQSGGFDLGGLGQLAGLAFAPQTGGASAFNPNMFQNFGQTLF